MWGSAGTRAAAVVAGAAAIVVAIVILSGGDRSGSREEPPARPKTLTTRLAPCAVGERPRYFVPGPPAALLGCARLPVSGKRVEFSGQLERIAGNPVPCINPAYAGGSYIPDLCRPDPPYTRFAIRQAESPAPAVAGYGYVIWGTTGGARRVTARFEGGVAEAAVFAVRRRLARAYAVEPFGVFVAELPPAARCAPVTVTADGRTDRVGPRRCG